jgi:hypothetical protein
VNFFNEYHPDYDIGYWLFACSIGGRPKAPHCTALHWTVGGSVGVVAGGLATDLLRRRLGSHSRLWLQVGRRQASCLLSRANK